MQLSIERSRQSARSFKPNAAAVKITAADIRAHGLNGLGLDSLGIHLTDHDIEQMIDKMGYVADNNDVGQIPVPLNNLTASSISTPVQFLQNWLSGFVNILTAARKIDTLTGISTIGSWEDEEIVQGVLEPLGTATVYGDFSNVPFASWNTNFERRTVVRFEMGMQVGLLEEGRTARMRVSSSAEKRAGAALALDIQRNRVGFYGYNDGANRTYGFLNDPSLPAYNNAPNGAGGSPLWSTKTYLEIVADIRVMLAGIQNQSQDTIDVETAPITFALPTAVYQYLSVVSQYGNSVRQWLTDTYPNVRVVSAPELNDGNGGASAAYMYAEVVQDGSSDDHRTFIQVVPAKFQVLGVEKHIKSYAEAYSNATAGIMCKRPYAVYRLSGI